jgi:hypothetical protein
MQLGMIGLGRMGGNMARRLQGGHQVVAYDRSPQPVQELEKLGATTAYSLKELVEKLTPPRSVWIMVPAGKPTAEMVTALAALLTAGDTIYRGRQFSLPRGCYSGGGTQAEEHSLPGCRDERGDLGPEGRLLPDGRWRAGSVRAA